jgi:hypothetical protein
VTLSLLAHEGVHQYLARCFGQPVPAWLNEGLACQFEAFNLRQGRPVFVPRENFLRRNHLREGLSHHDMIPLERMLSTHAGDALVGRTGSSRLYYAQAWALVLLLREDDRFKAGFARLLADAGTPRLALSVSAYRAATPDKAGRSDAEIAFRQYITDDLEAFARDYEEFCRNLVF